MGGRSLVNKTLKEPAIMQENQEEEDKEKL